MEETAPSVWANPAFQAGVLPFIVAFATAFVLRPLGWYWSGLAIALAFAATVWGVMGFEFTPLTSSRKLVILTLAAVVLGGVLDLVAAQPKKLRLVLAGLGVLAAGWLLWPQLKSAEGSSAWGRAGLAALYVAWLTTILPELRTRPVRAWAAALTLTVGSAGAILMGASALLAQLGIAMAMACGALLVLSVGKKVLPLGYLAALPLGLFVGLHGVTGVAYAQMEWLSLLALAAIPALAYLPLPKGPLWVQGAVALGWCTPAALLAIYFTWRVAGAPSL